MQVDALLRAGVPADRIYVDKASGAKEHRENLIYALKALHPGDVLVFWKLDRLTRSVRQLLEIAKIVESKGAHLRCLTQAIDTTVPSGRLLFTILGAIAEFERDLGRERTKEGLAAARARGRIGGRRPKYTAAQKAEALRLVREEKQDVPEAARRTKVRKATIYGWLRKES